MSERKNTPDILADLLTGAAPASEVEFAAPPTPPRRSAPRRPAAAKTAPPKVEPPAAPKTPRLANIAPAAYEVQVASFQEHGGWRVRFVNGQEVKNWTAGLTLLEYVSCMAAEGWHIVAAVHGAAMWSHYDKYQVFFHRPKV